MVLGGAKQKPCDLLQSFEMAFKTEGVQSDFKVLSSIEGDRVQKRRMQAIHNASGILCSIQLDSSFELAESSQILRNCIMYMPISKYGMRSIMRQVSIFICISFTGYHLIAYVRAWQIAINELAVQNGFQCAFRFNTYIISVFVIFFLQLNYDFPKLDDLAMSPSKFIDHVPQLQVSKADFKRAVKQFFEFYGRKYEKCKLISLVMGRWQNRYLDKHQTALTPERKKFVKSK